MSINNKPKRVKIIEDSDVGIIFDEMDKAQYEEYLKKKEAELKEKANEDSRSGSEQ